MSGMSAVGLHPCGWCDGTGYNSKGKVCSWCDGFGITDFTDKVEVGETRTLFDVAPQQATPPPGNRYIEPDRKTQRGKVGRNHPETSKAAALAGMPRFGTQRGRLYSHLYVAGVRGLTNAEAAELLQLSRNQTATRMLELREVGLAEDSGGTRATSATGDNRGIVWRLTDLGRAQYAAYSEKQHG